MERLDYNLKRLYNQKNLYLTSLVLILTIAIVAYLYEIKRYYAFKNSLEKELS